MAFRQILNNRKALAAALAGFASVTVGGLTSCSNKNRTVDFYTGSPIVHNMNLRTVLAQVQASISGVPVFSKATAGEAYLECGNEKYDGAYTANDIIRFIHKQTGAFDLSRALATSAQLNDATGEKLELLKPDDAELAMISSSPCGGDFMNTIKPFVRFQYIGDNQEEFSHVVNAHAQCVQGKNKETVQYWTEVQKTANEQLSFLEKLEQHEAEQEAARAAAAAAQAKAKAEADAADAAAAAAAAAEQEEEEEEEEEEEKPVVKKKKKKVKKVEELPVIDPEMEAALARIIQEEEQEARKNELSSQDRARFNKVRQEMKILFPWKNKKTLEKLAFDGLDSGLGK